MLRFYYSGAKANAAPQERPERSLGGFMSSTPVSSGELNSLFSDISSVTVQERTGQTICLFLRNELATSVYNVYLGYLATTSFKVGVSGVASDILPTTELLNKPEALPMSVQFSDLAITSLLLPPAEDGSGFLVEEFVPGQVLAVWLRREYTIPTPYDFEAELVKFKASGYENVGDEPEPENFELVLTYDDQP